MSATAGAGANAKNVLAGAIGAFVVPPMMWLLASLYFQVCSFRETVALASTPLLWIYVVACLGGVVGLTCHHLGRIRTCLADPSPENVIRAQRSLASFPVQFLVAVAVYCIIGPNSALYGQEFLDQTKYVLAWLLGIPIIFVFSIPFFLFMISNLERVAIGIPRSEKYKFLPLSTKMLIIFAFTTYGAGLILSLESICIVHSSSQKELFTALTTKLIVGGALTAAIAALNLLLLVGHALKPIQNITDATTKLARGEDLTNIDAMGRRDELGAIVEALQTFADLMAERRKSTGREEQQKRLAEAERKAALQQLAEIFEADVGSVIDVVTSSTKELQGSSRKVASTASATSDQAATVARAAEQAAVNVQTVASAAEELSQSIREISVQVERSQSVAERADREAGHTSELITRLSENVTSIGEIVGLINGIASQTNLLALNATIEAARAGEAGKGFTVVAGEVKALARETANAINQIDSRIRTVQQVTASAVSAVGSITAVINEMARISTAVAAAVEQQTAATGEISRNVDQASSGTQEVSEFIRGVENSTKDTGAAAHQMDNSSAGLSQQADRLKQKVSDFLQQVRSDDRTRTRLPHAA